MEKRKRKIWLESRVVNTFKKLLATFITAYNQSFIVKFSRIILRLALKLSKPLNTLFLKLKPFNGFFSRSWLGRNLFSAYTFSLFLFLFFVLSGVPQTGSLLLILLVSVLSCLIGAYMGDRFSRYRLCFTPSLTTVRTYCLIALITGLAGLSIELFRVGGIPLLDPSLKRGLAPVFTYMAWTLAPACFALLGLIYERFVTGKWTLEESRVYLTVLWLVITFMLSLLGYRTDVVVCIIGSTLTLYYLGVYGITDLLGFLLFAFAIYGLTSAYYYAFTGVFRNPISAVLTRASIAVYNLQLLIERCGLGGYTRGALQLAGISSMLSFIPGPRLGPRTILMKLIGGRERTMTATLIAPFLVDFGIYGVVFEMTLLGFFIQLYHNLSLSSSLKHLSLPFYAVIYAFAVVAIETGLLDLNVYVYYLASILVLACSLKRVKKG